MTRLDKMPDPIVIRQFRGVIDFATWRGVTYARTWPKKAATLTIPTLEAADLFKRVSRELSNTWAPMREYCTQLSRPFNWTWKDTLTAGYYQNLLRNFDTGLAPHPAALVNAQLVKEEPDRTTIYLTFSQPTEWSWGFDTAQPFTHARYVFRVGTNRLLGFTQDYEAGNRGISFIFISPTIRGLSVPDTLWQNSPHLSLLTSDVPILNLAQTRSQFPRFTLADLDLVLPTEIGLPPTP